MSSSKISSTKRKKWLDAVKGIAIILVVMSHTGSGVPYLHKYMIACYMPLFFIASGYVFKEMKGAIQRKCTQLLLPYIGWAIFYLLVTCIGHREIDLMKIGTWIAGIIYSRFSLFELGPVPPIRLLPPGAAPLWFLTCMVLSYLLFCPLVRLKSRMIVALIIAYMGISVGFMFCPILMPWSLDTAFMGALFIYAGYLLKNVQLNNNKIWIALLVCLPIYLVVSHINGDVNMSIRVYGNPGPTGLLLFGITGILGSVSYAAFFMLTCNTWLCSFFAYFGRLSLTVMCAHMFFARGVMWLYGYCSSRGIVMPRFLYSVVQLAIILLCCMLTHYVLNYLKNEVLSRKSKPSATDKLRHV